MDERMYPGGKPPLSFKEIADRILDVDGNTVQPKRGVNIIEQLTRVSSPVQLDNLFKVSDPVPVENVRPDISFSDNLEGYAASQGNRSGLNNSSKPMSYADSVCAAKSVKVNFRFLASTDAHEGCDVVLPRDSVKVVQEKLANTLYGYFLGDRVAYPVVDYFVRTNWKKHGLQKSMMNANGFFFFKFADKDGMTNVLKEGPWIIRGQPIFLNVWSPTSKLEKKEVKKLQLWVKIHDVPIAAYTEDGLSMIATAIGDPKMLDSYTSSMCMDTWGRSSYARALLEISADNDFKEEIVIAVPDLEGEGFVKQKLYVEYEWSPYRCAHCKVFGHSDDTCPRQTRRIPKEPVNIQKQYEGTNRQQGKQPVIDKDGFMDVVRKKAARKTGFPVSKQKQKFEYRPIGPKTNPSAQQSNVVSKNSFEVLRDKGLPMGQSSSGAHNDQQDSDDEEVTEVYNETNGDMTSSSARVGASTYSSKFYNG